MLLSTDWSIQQVADAMGFPDQASLGQFFKRNGMPSTIGELGGSEADIDKLAHVACYGNGRDGKLRGFV